MKNKHLAIATLVLAGALGFIAHAESKKAKEAPVVHEGNSYDAPIEQIKFEHTIYKPRGKEITVARMYYDENTGRTGRLMKFPPGFEADVHTHTQDYYAVVIKGQMSNHKPNEKAATLNPGSYWFQRGEESHVTECVSKTEDCLAFIVTRGEFDVQVQKYLK